MIYVTSDTHFNHPNICGPSISKWETGYRNFGSLKEMDDTILDGINSRVCVNDILIHCGDFGFFRNNPTLYYTYREQIRCKRIYLILGNHDKDVRTYWKQLEKDDVFIIRNQWQFHVNWDNKAKSINKGLDFVVYHYPKPEMRKKFPFIVKPNEILLHGHIHTNPPSIQMEPYKSIDVGVDGNNFKPWSIQEIVNKLGFTGTLDNYYMEHYV